MDLDRTLSMMEYEDWRPKLGPMSPAELWYMQMAANSTPRYTSDQLRPMTAQELCRFQQGSQNWQGYSNSLFDALLGPLGGQGAGLL